MKILITGVHGFVGSSLVKAWGSEHSIYGLDIVSPIKEGVKETFNWDALDKPEALPEFDAIIHLAGLADDNKDERLREKYMAVNYGLTKKIYDFYLKSSAKKFIFFSSIKAAFDFFPEGEITEDMEPMPIGPYGESKIAAENYILNNRTTKFCKHESYNQTCLGTTERRQNGQSQTPKAEKLTYILRPCMIHGPGNQGNLGLLYSVVKFGIPWPLGAWDNRRTFTSIGNLEFVLRELLQGKAESGIYNMGDDESMSTNELIAFMWKMRGAGHASIWKLPKWMMRACAAVGTALHIPFNKINLTKLTENYVVSNKKIKAAIGIDHMPLTAIDGLKKTLRSMA